MDSLILASKSPRRKEILQSLKIPFIVFPPQNFTEKFAKDGKQVKLLVIRNSKEKALSVSKYFKNGLILGVDTVVCIGNKILGKPSNRHEAKRYLKMLNGRMHSVYSGISLIDVRYQKVVSSIAETDVFFKKLSMEEIEDYIMTDEWVDKAGGYAIQGRASLYIKGIVGSFYNVVGLPVELLYDMLKKFKYFESNGTYTPLKRL